MNNLFILVYLDFFICALNKYIFFLTGKSNCIKSAQSIHDVYKAKKGRDTQKNNTLASLIVQPINKVKYWQCARS